MTVASRRLCLRGTTRDTSGPTNAVSAQDRVCAVARWGLPTPPPPSNSASPVLPDVICGEELVSVLAFEFVGLFDCQHPWGVRLMQALEPVSSRERSRRVRPLALVVPAPSRPGAAGRGRSRSIV